MTPHLTLLPALLLAGPVLAADPSFDCARAGSSAEEAVCASADLAALDRELSRLYGLAARGANMTDDRLKELRAYQRGWVKGRDDCWKSPLGVEPCVRDEYALRIGELRTRYADARAQDGASAGPFPYVCDGLDVPISATFVNAGTPLAALTWRDGYAVLPLGPSGSGARYASDDAEFWVKGDSAMLTLPDQGPLDCKRDATG